MNTYAIRQCLGEYFSNNIKRDTSEFIIALCTKYDSLKNLLEYKINSTSRCKSCNNTKCTVNSNLIISIPITNLKNKSYKLQDLIDNTFSHWHQSFNELCEFCAGNNILLKNELISTQNIIAIRIFLSQDYKLVTKCNINLCAIPTTKVLIAGQYYKVMNAIFLHGNIDNGHYTSICREGISEWIEVDDTQIRKRQWPRGSKDIYMIFLQKLGNKQ